MTTNIDPQVVVIGGGPADSTVSMLLAQQGVRVELFERERFPRFHIGESSHFIKRHGVQLHEDARVLDVLFENERAIGVDVAFENGTKHRALTDVVVDTSGQSSMIINRFGLRVPDPALNKGVIWTYFKGAYRDQGQDEGARDAEHSRAIVPRDVLQTKHTASATSR